MSEFQVAQSSASTCSWTDARIRSFAWERSFEGPDIDKIEAGHSASWSQISFSLARVLEAKSARLSNVRPWEDVFEMQMPTLSENRIAETAHIYVGAIAVMDSRDVVCISDVVGSGICISSSSGQRVFDAIQSAIMQGNKIRLSFRNIKSLSPAFLESAIGQLYNGKIREDMDNKLSFEDLSPGRRLIVDEVIGEAKKYYSNPDEYMAKMNMLLADD